MIEPATLELISEQYRKKLPFVVYSLPDSQEITVILQKNSTYYPTEDFTKSAFVFYPFSNNHKDYCIPKEHATVLKQQVSLRLLETQPINFEENAATKSQYEDLVSKTVSNIKTRNAQKIVVSRKASLTIAPINFEEILYRLLLIYPTAFRYLWYHPETSIWCGVTPEVLLKTSDTCFTTMALAGTQKNDSIQRIEWGEKERNEHQLVIDDIVDKLQSILSVIKVSKTYNFNAGPVVHLRTDITGCIKKGKSTLTEIAASLHPTSAVCGTPEAFLKNSIETHEVV
ncbi:MAG: chorismate-binding protein [Flavobacteriaceae bacterium]